MELLLLLFNSHADCTFAILPALIAAGGMLGGGIAGSLIQSSSAQSMNREMLDWEKAKYNDQLLRMGDNRTIAMDFEREMVGRQEAFQEKMSNSAYQRQVEDMEKAGINPMLAVMKGGGAPAPQGASGNAPSASMSAGSTPSLNVPQIGQGITNAITNALSTAMEVSKFKQESEQREVNVEAAKAGILKTIADTEFAQSGAGKNIVETAGKKMENLVREWGLPTEKKMGLDIPMLKLLGPTYGTGWNIMNKLAPEKNDFGPKKHGDKYEDRYKIFKN